MAMTRGEESERRVGRPRTISREMIADSAIELIVEQGTDALTLQTVAKLLGVKHPALYRYVTGRSDLLRAIADRFMASTTWPTPGDDWREYLRSVAHAIDFECGRVPGIMNLMYNEVWPLPKGLILAGMEMTQNLVTLGFPEKLAFNAADIVADFAADSRIRRDRINERGGSWESFTQAFTSEDSSWEHQRTKYDAYFSAGPDVWSESKLSIILDGIETQLLASGGSGDAP